MEAVVSVLLLHPARFPGWHAAAERYEDFLRTRKGQMTAESPKHHSLRCIGRSISCQSMCKDVILPHHKIVSSSPLLL